MLSAICLSAICFYYFIRFVVFHAAVLPQSLIHALLTPLDRAVDDWLLKIQIESSFILRILFKAFIVLADIATLKIALVISILPFVIKACS